MTTTIVQNSFLPTQISGCQLWLDAADSSTITGTSPVTSWRDKSGTGRTVTFTGTNTYTSSPASVNTNSASSYFSADADVRKTTIPNVSIFLVYKWNSSTSGTNQFLWGGDVGGGWNRIQILTFPLGTSFQYSLAYTGSSPYATPVSGLNNGNLLLYNANYAYGVASGTYVNVNGSLATSLVTEGAASAQTSYSGVNFGNGNGDVTYACSASFSEIIIYYGILTATQRQQVEGYLAQKWGLQASLPSNHPYKYSAYFTNLGYVSTILSPVNTNQITNAVFNPASIPGCKLWLDGKDTSSASMTLSGKTVTTWKDKSGNGSNATGVNSPQLISTGGVSFIAASSQTFSFSIPYASTHTIYIVATPSSSSQTYLFGRPSPNSEPAMILNYSGTSLEYYDDPDSGRQTFGSPTSTFIASYIRTPNVSVVGRLNGSEVFTEAGPTTEYSTVSWGYLGSANGSVGYYTGTIYEFMIFTASLTTSQAQQIEGYLAWKWGLQVNLPPTHPYKYTSAVFVTQPRALTILGANPYNNTMVSSYFNPKSISGLQFWIDGADKTSITFASANTISAWNDKSGNGYNLLQGTSSNQPTYSSNYINLGTASNYYMNMPQGAVNNASAWSMFFIINPSSSSNWLMAKQWDGVNSLNILSMTYNGFRSSGTTNVLYFRALNTGTLFSGSPALTTSTVQMISMIYDGTNMYYYLNGNLGSTTAGSFGILNEVRATTCTLGAWIVSGGLENSGTTNFNLGELQFFNNAITTTQRQKNEGYLAWKWGLQANLPATHPYKLFPTPP